MDQPFKDVTPPSAPDYTKPEAWAARPGKASNADLTIDGEAPVPNEKRLVDCFYVHPSGWFSNTGWNCPIPESNADDMMEFWMHPTQASAFNNSCRIWSPQYRQASFYIYLLGESDDARAALSLAYTDVVRAFQQFLVEIGPHKPFVIAAHSQGGHHMIRLLEECIDSNPDLVKRMVVSYIVGARLPLDKFTRSYKNLREGTGPEDVGGVVTGWDTKSRDADTTAFKCGIWYKTGWEQVTKETPTLNTNPISWTASGKEGPVSNGYLGALKTDVDVDRQFTFANDLATNKPMGITKITSATCYQPKPVDDAAKFSVESRLNRIAIPEIQLDNSGWYGTIEQRHNYHMGDFALFYFNIRENLKSRIEAYFKQQRKRKRESKSSL